MGKGEEKARFFFGGHRWVICPKEEGPSCPSPRTAGDAACRGRIAPARAPPSCTRPTGARPVPAKRALAENSKKLRRREAGWRASERTMQTITKVNLIRLTSRSSLRASERRQAHRKSRCDTWRAHPTAMRGHGWTQWLRIVCRGRASVSEGGRADGKGRVVSDAYRKGRDRFTNAQPNRTSPRPSAVRALVRAKNPGNAGGAKGGRKRNA